MSDFEYSRITNVEFDGINHRDAPDYVDAFIISADYDGEPMTEKEIEDLNEDYDLVYEKLMEYLN